MLLNYSSDALSSVSHSTRASLVLGVTFPLHFLALLFVTARILVKIKLGKFGREDILIIIALGFALIELVLTTIACRFGFGMHTSEIQVQWEPEYSKINFAINGLGCMPYIFTKGSMICFYLRLAPHPSFRILCYFSAAFIISSSSIITFVNILGCSPIEGGWKREPSFHSTCITSPVFYYYAAVNNIVADILLLGMPIPILVRLQLPIRAKIAVIAMFSTGLLVTSVSSWFLYSFYRVLHSKDNTWDGAFSWMLAMVEYNVAIITTCMPGMMMFVKWARGDSLGKPVLGKPGTGGNENATIGGKRWRCGGGGRADVESRDMISYGSEEYSASGGGGMVKLTEVLVETSTTVRM